MKQGRITGIGGVFFKSTDPEKLRGWYEEHFSIKTDEYGTNFEWRKASAPDQKGFTLWSPFPVTTDYFEPSTKEFMINFRVENLEALLEDLKDKGVTIVGTVQNLEYGRFAHVIDPEGNKIELWEPDDEEYDKIVGNARV